MPLNFIVGVVVFVVVVVIVVVVVVLGPIHINF